LLVFASTLLIGCGAKKPSVAPATKTEPSLPTHAQPKLKTIQLWIGPEQFMAEMALTPIQMQTGLMFRTNIPENEGMIFVLPFPQRASFWMKNCPESISAAYISPDGVIQEIHHLEHQDTNAVLSATENIQFVLETREGWFKRHNINPGVVIRTQFGSLAETFLQRRQ
jgi:uncharacterized membrane protein (UPF0127 family)